MAFIRREYSVEDVNDAGGSKILLLEDDPGIRAVSAYALEHIAGYDVTPAATIEEALASIEASPFDGAVLDFHLGEDDSRQVAQKLQDLSVPYVILSGDDPNADMKQPEGSAWLTKPVHEQVLVDTLRKLLGETAPNSGERSAASVA